jgi:hypothetical protein
MADKVNIADKFTSFNDTWAPRIVARYNDNEVRLVKVEGEFIWHQHPGYRRAVPDPGRRARDGASRPHGDARSGVSCS